MKGISPPKCTEKNSGLGIVGKFCRVIYIAIPRWWWFQIFFIFTFLTLGKFAPIWLAHIFQRGWFNHQLDSIYPPTKQWIFPRCFDFSEPFEFSVLKRKVDVKEFHDSTSKRLPKIKISPENWWLEDVFPIKHVPFLGRFVHFRGCNVRSWKNSIVMMNGWFDASQNASIEHN